MTGKWEKTVKSFELFAFVSRGPHSGKFLYPHLHNDGRYAVSMTRFESDYVWLSDRSEILSWLEKGYRLRMSNPEDGISATSLIRPGAIYRPVAMSRK
ncbi:hypothetical protein AAFN88_10370 [Pelagibius sp. CAU 1746]|uniref:hypothetical protein n=1 Tax=Pelagibius sp. CAU 1746 TaxID=3140370 RepID=UPI00325AF8E2